MRWKVPIQQDETMTNPVYSQASASIRACTECIIACQTCAAECLQEEMVGMMHECIRRCLDCVELCRLCISYEIRGSALLDNVMALCAQACERCAEECGAHEDQHCQHCAKACEQCAEICRASEMPID